jgi:hypothetical protein
MSAGPIIIRQRWWGHLVVLFCLPIVATLGVVFGSAGIGLFGEAGGWWKGLFLIAGAVFMLFVVVFLLNNLFTFRLEIDARGLRMVGNFWTHDLAWQEITRTEKSHNNRAPGYHVHVMVDGSRYPRRHWSNLWFAGYGIPSLMEKGATDLAAYLKRKRRDALRPQRAAAGQ